LLKPGGTVVENRWQYWNWSSSYLQRQGYKCLIVIPETQSQEKIDALKTQMFASLPCLLQDQLCEALAQEMENAIWANQFDNLANRRAHYKTTGAEIWGGVG